MKILYLLTIIFILIAYSCADSGKEITTQTCNDICNYWEYCDLETNTCKINTKYGFCITDSDCGTLEICNKETRKCEKKSDNCSPDCYDWEQCIDGECKLKNGHCYWNNDCKEGYFCNTENNKCEKLSEECNLNCKTWEECSIQTDGKRICINKQNFEWKKLELQNEDSIKAPYGITAFAYDFKNEIMLTYLKRSDITGMGETSVMGKLDLNTKIQSETALIDNESILSDLFFCNEENKCQYGFYDNENNNFILISLDASLIIKLNYREIVSKSFSFMNIPSLSESISVTYSQNGKYFYVYNNVKKGNNKSILYKYSINDNLWNETIKDLPNVSGNCLVEINDKIYSFGGILTYGRSSENNYISKYYIIDTDENEFYSYDMPDTIGQRSDISCTYDKKRNLIYLFGGYKINDEHDESKNEYHADLFTFNPQTNEFKLINEIKELGDYSPLNEDGERIFNAGPDNPVFGKNHSKLIYDEKNDRLIVFGKIPPQKGIQLYLINLSE